MPYISDQQRKFFNVNRKALEEQGVDVEHWNSSSRGLKLPKKKKEKGEPHTHCQMDKTSGDLDTAITGETPGDLYKRLLVGAVDRKRLLENASTFPSWKGFPGLIGRAAARKAIADGAAEHPEKYLESLRKLDPDRVKRFIRDNSGIFKSVSSAIPNGKVAGLLFGR